MCLGLVQFHGCFFLQITGSAADVNAAIVQTKLLPLTATGTVHAQFIGM